MHPVISHLLERKNKKVPITDERNITLVLFGGIMVGVRGAGALVALQELGLTNSFDEIYTMSSGFINGSSFLSEQTRLASEIYYKKLSGLKFLNPFRFWKIADMDYILKIIKESSFNVNKVLESKTKLYNMLINLSENRPEYLEVHNFDAKEYSDLFEASLCIKLIAGGNVKIREKFYRDIFSSQEVADFFNHVIKSKATDILVIYNYSWQKNYIRKIFPQLDNKRIYEIYPEFDEKWIGYLPKLTRFDTRSSVLKKQCQIFGDETKRIFGSKEPVKLI